MKITRYRSICRAAVALICLCGPSAAPLAAQQALRAGAAKVEITPELGVSLDGSISKNGPATSVHDPLHARALVLDDGRTRIAIVIVDQCMTAREVFDSAKGKVQRAIGLPVDRILVAATHTHAAPRTIHIGRKPIDDRYHERLAQWIAQSVMAADRNLAPARIAFATFEKPDLIACRRFVCEPGSVGVNPFGVAGEQVKSVAGSSTRVLRPAGPTDPEFSVISVQHADGTPLALLGNFSVHYCGGYRRGAVSADYFGYFCAAVESMLSGDSDDVDSPHPPVIGLMFNGTSGDTGSFQRSGRKFAPFEGMQYYGRMLADDAVAAAARATHRSDVTIEMQQRELELSIRRPDADRVRWARGILDNPDITRPHRWTKIYAEEALHLAEYPAAQAIKLQAIRIGDIGIAAAPCEVFAETGLGIKKHSPLAQTFTIELANGYSGYLPTREQHRLGGYETWAARSSLLEFGAEEKIRETLLELLSGVASERDGGQ